MSLRSGSTNGDRAHVAAMRSPGPYRVDAGMAPRSGDPHEIESVLVGEDEYQAPPREEEEERSPAAEDGGTAQEAAGEPIDINLLDAQRQRPGLQISETIVVDPSEKTEFTVSGPDEEQQPGGPRAVPPGESM